MRRKLLAILLLLAALPGSLSAGILPKEPPFNRFRFGAEWGYTQCFFLYRDYNYITDEGYRVYEHSFSPHWQPNAQIIGQVGYILTDRSLLSIGGGYMGIGKGNRLFPAYLRYSFYPHSLFEDGFFTYAQAGAAWHIHPMDGRTALLGALGGGYRVHLSTDCDLDLLVGLKYLHDHPALVEDGFNIPGHSIRKNIAGYCALDISIAISF